MGKRKERSEILETLIRRGGGEDDGIMEGEKEGFFACYLLTSLSPRFKGHSYIGFTVNPRRRIRQHNGEIRCGAFRTKNRRPWEMVLCIYGFPTNIAALQFEWAWQHPIESLAVRKAAAAFKSLSGIANKIKLAYTMLTLPAWQSFNLTVNFFSTKYTKHSAGCPSLPEHMKVQVRSMDELPCYTGGDWNVVENVEWDETEEFDATGEASGLIMEGLEDAPVHNSDDFQNGELDGTGRAYRLVNEKLTDATVHVSAHDDHHNSIEETTSERITSIEENGTRRPFCLNNSLERTLLSSFATNSNKEIFEDRVIFRLIEECNVELDRPTTTAPHKSRPTNKSFSSIPCEVEVIDVFTPSPDNRIRSQREKRGASTICPEIIDLTKSPIFV